MGDRFQSILDAALALPEAERVALIDELVESLPPDTGPPSDEEMLAELKRRRAEVEQGLVKPLPWSEFRWKEGE